MPLAGKCLNLYYSFSSVTAALCHSALCSISYCFSHLLRSCGFLFAGVYGPSVTNMDYVLRYQYAMKEESESALLELKVSHNPTAG